MTETKKRGRPTNAEREARELAKAAEVLIEAHEAHEAHVGPALLAKAYALRVWSGQSNDLPRSERIERVMSALKGQNLPTEGIELP